MEQDSDNGYKLKLSANDGGITVDKEISAELAHRILVLLVPSSASKVSDVGGGNGEAITPGVVTPKAFMVQKKPATDIERITCLAYYLARYRNTPEFKTEELTDLNREAQQVRFSNPSAAARNAVQFGYLSLAGGGRKQITSTGEAVVDAMPDRDMVKKALEEQHRPRLRRSKKTGKRKATEASAT
jgi:hypothetical protein